MFIGHFGLGFSAKAAAPQVSLGTLFLAAQFLDLLWPTFLLLGWETVRIQPGATALTPLVFEHYPISHSLLAASLWGLLLGGAHFQLKKDAIAAVVVGLLVPSHWALDLLVHAPDLPLAPGSDVRAGFGLWNSAGIALVVELAVFAAGVLVYARATRSRDRSGTWGLWTLVVLLLAIHAANVLGDPPPSVGVLAWVAQAQWLLVLMAYWVDRHRRPERVPAVAPWRLS